MSVRNKTHLMECEIVGFSKKGHGIGYFDRQDQSRWPVEVPFTVPGDQVAVSLRRKRSGLYHADLKTLVRESSLRIVPKCFHFGRCGGCCWQQIPYARQLEEKEALIHRFFGEWLSSDVEWQRILPAPSEWHYRNKMEFSFSSDASRNRYLGLVLNQSKGRVFHLTECHLPHPWFVKAVNATRGWWEESDLDAYHTFSNTGSLRTLVVREGQRTGDRMVHLTVSGNPAFALKKHHLEGFIAFLRDAVEPINPDQKLSLFLTIQQTHKGHPTQFFEMHLYGSNHIRETLYIKIGTKETVPLTFYISPSAFFQPNTAQAEVLYSTALKMAQLSSESVIYDLYCGTGALGICAAKQVKQVVGIELSPASAYDARYNVQMNELNNVTIITGSVGEELAKIRENGSFPSPHLVMVDPPRSGLDPDAMKQLISLKAPKILYISCNPETQAANIRQFVQEGYRLKAIQPVDQFPHTFHIENIALLVL